jgi:lysophospholipase L1-like esterase
MTTGSEHSILCYGDSNTHGTLPMPDDASKARRPRSDRWTGVLAGTLGPGFHVIEEGQPGRTTVHDDPIEGAHKNGRTVLPAILETHRPIDMVVLMLGTNDLKARFAVTPADIARSLASLVDIVRGTPSGPDGGAPDIVLIAPAPIVATGWLAGHFTGGAAKSQALSPLIAALAKGRDAGFVDAASCGAVDPLDGVHLTKDAHHALGVAVADMVRARLNG